MITSGEQNCSVTPCDWCLDISQITTLCKPQMIHKNQCLLAEQYFSKVTGSVRLYFLTCVAVQMILLLYI